MPASKVINHCGFCSLFMGLCRGVPFVSFRCLGSKPGYQPKQPKELLMCEVRVCNWNDKGSPIGTVYHPTQQTQQSVLEVLWTSQMRRGVSSETTLFTFYIFLPPRLWCGAARAQKRRPLSALRLSERLQPCQRTRCRPINWDKAGRDWEAEINESLWGVQRIRGLSGMVTFMA